MVAEYERAQILERSRRGKRHAARRGAVSVLSTAPYGYRYDVLFPRTGNAIDIEELKHWLRFGLDEAHRGHDGTPEPIIDANSLVIFLRFARYAREYCERHQLADLGKLWSSIEQAAQKVENEHQGTRRPSRFDAPVS